MRRKLHVTLRRGTGMVLGVLILLGVSAPAVWASSGVSQGFTTSAKHLVPGTIMGLQPGSQNVVVPAVSAHRYQLLGIVADQPLIALSSSSSQVQIVISGLTEALVSDINGAVHAGDRVTASPISGVGMKATDSGQVVGTAQANLADSNPTQQTVTDKNGHKHTVMVGIVPLQVSVGYYAGPSDQSKLASLTPPGLISFASSITGQQVSALRVIVGSLILIIGFIIVANMLQASIRGSVTAMGRNPLAKSAIHRELLDICLTALGVLLLTIIVVYLVIKL